MGLTDRCKSGKRCVSRTSDGAALTSNPLCDGCVRDIQKSVNDLPGYIDLLELFKGHKPGSVGQSKVGGSTVPSSPLNTNVLDLIYAIHIFLDELDGYLVRDFATFPGGVDFVLRARKLHSQADGIVGLQRVWERRRVPCPECDLPTLGGWVGEDRIYCTNSECGTVLSKTEYETYCEVKSKRR